MEVRSETGAMASREPFTVGLQKSPVQQQQSSMQSMRLTFASDGTAIYKQVNPTSPPYQQSSGAPAGGGGNAGGASDGSPQPPPPAPRGPPPAPHHGLNMNMGEHVKRKRGRPRKYGPDGTMALVLSPNPMSSPPSVAPPVSTGGGGFSSPMGAASTNPASSPSGLSSPTGVKKARGRPPGSGKKQQMAALGSAGSGFTPHVLTVKAGEDVSSIIMSFLQNGPRAVCILSANGAISNVTLRQAATSGGTVTYEGRFEILSLSGSFLLSESGGQRSRTGGLSVSLAGPDGRVLGGGVAGLLTAASPVQVVVGSFIAEGKKEHKEANPSPYPGFGSGHSAGNTGPSSPPSRGTLSESSGGPGSPINQSTGGCNNGAQHGVSSMPWK